MKEEVKEEGKDGMKKKLKEEVKEEVGRRRGNETEPGDCEGLDAEVTEAGVLTGLSIFPNFKENQHCILVVTTSVFQCCFWKFGQPCLTVPF